MSCWKKTLQGMRKCVLKWMARKYFVSGRPVGGFDRNLWNAKAIHSAIKYIEHNPVRAGLVKKAEEWKWSSAHARHTRWVGFMLSREFFYQ